MGLGVGLGGGDRKVNFARSRTGICRFLCKAGAGQAGGGTDIRTGGHSVNTNYSQRSKTVLGRCALTHHRRVRSVAKRSQPGLADHDGTVFRKGDGRRPPRHVEGPLVGGLQPGGPGRRRGEKLRCNLRRDRKVAQGLKT